VERDELLGDEHFPDEPGHSIFGEVRRRVLEAWPEVELSSTRSQIALRTRHAFAWLWRPGRYVSGSVPLVVSFALSRRLDSPRVKEIVEPSPKRHMHHVEVRTVAEVDDELMGWLREAHQFASRGSD